MSGIKPIQTFYKGYHFRSRLEARWAVFFSALGLKWEYEPEGFDLGGGDFYLPDFRVHYPGRDKSERHVIWFEVKGDLRDVTQDEWRKLIKFHSAKGLIVLDDVPDTRMYCDPKSILIHEAISEKAFVPSTPYKVATQTLDRERYGAALWCSKGRLWWDEYTNFFNQKQFDYEDIEILYLAANAAKSARFEHGQKGASQ